MFARKKQPPARKNRLNLPEVSMVDRIIGAVAPKYAMRRYSAKAAFALTGGYTGASRKRRTMSQYAPGAGDADADILPDLPTLRERSRDLLRNEPLATGIVNTKVTEVVGTGLKHQSRVNRDILNLSEEQAEELENKIDTEWSLFWDNIEVDLARTLNGNGITEQVYRQEKENGDVLILFPRITRGDTPYSLRMQIVEADRLCNKDFQPNTKNLSGGIAKDNNGAPTKYQVLQSHPGAIMSLSNRKWKEILAYGSKTGLKNVIHYFHPTRPGQSRGVPDLSPVVELIKTLGAYATNELVAAEVASLFTVFIKSTTGETEMDLTKMAGETGATSSDDNVKLGNGAILGLRNDESIETADPKRPNQAFDQFIKAISRQIGVAVNLPYEILIKHFTASYSASRAALLTAWKYFIAERKWLADNFCQPVKNIWMYEAVGMGRIAAPGFFTDPILRRAYASSMWTGPAKGMIDEKKEADAADKRIEIGITTIAEETIQMTGGDFDTNHPQRAKEHKLRKEAGLIAEAPQPGPNAAPPSAPDGDDKKDDDNPGGPDDETT